MTAAELFGVVDRDTRGKAKTVNFAILYGISSWGLAGRLGVPKDEGKAIIERYFTRFPGIRAYIDETLNFVRENGFTRTLFGRKTHFPNIRASNPSFRAGAERAAINAPIQGTSADLIKRAMNRMRTRRASSGPKGGNIGRIIVGAATEGGGSCDQHRRPGVDRLRRGCSIDPAVDLDIDDQILLRHAIGDRLDLLELG